MNSKELLFNLTDFLDIYRLDGSIILELTDRQNVFSSSPLNGGFCKNIKSVFNCNLSQEDIDFLENNDLMEFLESKSCELSLNYKTTTGLITTASMDNCAIICKNFKDIEIVTIATAGVRVNASAAGDKASYYEHNGEYHFTPGTINLIIFINANLEINTLFEASITTTEAKTVALRDLRIPSLYSNSYATGTGTDGIVIGANKNSKIVFTNAGKHSKLGELIAKSVIEAIKEALFKQMFMSVSYQHSVIQRLNRFKVDINEFYRDFNEAEKTEFIKEFLQSQKRDENVAIASSILNIIDEVQDKLILKSTAYNLANNILDENCDDLAIKNILRFWIEYYLK